MVNVTLIFAIPFVSYSIMMTQNRWLPINGLVKLKKNLTLQKCINNYIPMFNAYV